MFGFKLFLLTILLFIVDYGACINCWECNSVYEVKCLDPFDNSSMPITDCSTKQTDGQKPTTCVKIRQGFRGEKGTIILTTERRCGWAENEIKSGPCVTNTKNPNLVLEDCLECVADGCNAIQSVIPIVLSNSTVFKA